MNIDLSPGPDLAPIYPTPGLLHNLLESQQQLTLKERQTLIAHSLHKAAVFGDITLLTYILRTPIAKVHADLSVKDEEGLGLVSHAILGFGEESDRDIEREETIRLLISEGADPLTEDAAGWTPLHHAVLHAPPTLITYLITHGASPVARSHKGLTPLDIISAYEELPGRQDVAFLLEEAMRGCGWGGSERERQRERRKKLKEAFNERYEKQTREWNTVGKILDLEEGWWGNSFEYDMDEDAELSSESGDEDSDEEDEPTPYTPSKTFSTMLVFSLPNLPNILHSLIGNTQPVLRPLSRRAAPANGLYLLARFACIWCDESWLEDVIVGAVDKIEEVVYARPEDLAHLAFWLYNTTLFLHLLRCDSDVAESCESLELFDLLDELINAIYVFVIRIAEKRVDLLIDSAILDYSPLSSEFDSIQFEGDNWSFFRNFATPKKKPNPISPPKNQTPKPNGNSPSPGSSAPSRPQTPPVPAMRDSPGAKAFSSLRSTFNRSSPSPSLTSVFRDAPSPNSTPTSAITSILTALHTLLSLYSINPTIIVQAYSQILYWTSCELFNRLLTRKRYLCRSRAMQIGMNVSAIEEWVLQVGLPKGVANHFLYVRELLSWLQCLSSINDFPALIDTIQGLRRLNPLQMRRAVREYRYEVGEGRMTEECTQYLAQLQKDWERRRVKLGIELARKERELERADGSSNSDEVADGEQSNLRGSRKNRERDEAQQQIDMLFDRNRPKSGWTPPQPPEVLGELMDSRFMIPLMLPSDPTLICAVPGVEALHPPMAFTAGMDSFGPAPSPPEKSTRPTSWGVLKSGSTQSKNSGGDLLQSRSSSRASHTSSHGSISSITSVTRGPMRWRKRGRRVRMVDVDLLDLVDGGRIVSPPEGLVFETLAGRTFVAGSPVIGLQPTISVDIEDLVPTSENRRETEGQEEGSGMASASRTVEFATIQPPPTIKGHPPEMMIMSHVMDDYRTESPTHDEIIPDQSRLTLNPVKPAMAERRRSIRLARRSSGGETARPTDNDMLDDTPTKDRSKYSFA